MNKFYLVCLWFVFLLVSSCYSEADKDYEGRIMGYKPIYISYETVKKVSFTDPRPLRKSGKIYVKDGYLFVSEPHAGIHIINNFDQKNPKPVKFINIPGNMDMAVKGNVLYADNGLDLLALDISDPANVHVIKRIEGVLPYPLYPPFENVKFECPDPGKGYVIEWQFVELDSPKCYR